MVAAYGAPLGDVSPQRRGHTSWGIGSPAQLVVTAHSAPVGHASLQMAPADRLGGRVVEAICWSPVSVRLWGMAAPDGVGSQAWGTGVRPNSWWQLTVHLCGVAAPNGAGSQAERAGSPVQSLVAAYGAPVGDGSPQWHRSTGLGDGEFSPAAGRSSRCACGGWQPPMEQAQRLGGRGVQLSGWSQLTMRLWGVAASNCAGSHAGGTGSPV